MTSAARSVAPAEQWRRELAQAIFTPDTVAVRIVFTCSPGNPTSAKGYVDPEAAHGRFEEVFLGNILRQVERNGLGVGLADSVGGEAYAPLEGHSGYMALLAARLHRELLAPFGAQGLLNAFLLDANGQILGWIALGTRRPSPEALRELGPQLTEIARQASRTLQATLDLAASCGALLPPGGNSRLGMLTQREAEVARMVANGCSDLNIAQSLKISENTVGSHLRRVYAKLGVHSRAEIAALVFGHGILDAQKAAS